MRSLGKHLSLLAFLGGAAVLHADTAPPAPAKPLSTTEIVSGATKVQQQIQDDYQHTLYVREQARKQKDVIKLSCVNDKLVQLKAQMNIADSTNEQLQASLTTNGDDRQSLYTQLTQNGSNIRLLREEAAACIGEPELYKQEAGGSFTAPEVPDDPTNPPENNGIEPPEPPGYASPYR
jgi:hypothetical protein